MPTARRHGCLASLLGLLLLGVAVVYLVAAITSPWAFHIGGRWTPLLYWSGTGNLVTSSGTYPYYVTLFPDSHFSKLHLDGLRPTGGIQGTGSLCVSPNAIQRVKLSGTIFGGWRSTEGALIEFRSLERLYISMGQRQGFFDLYGRFQGAELVMDDRGRYSEKFRSGLQIQHASVTFSWGGYSDFQVACAARGNH